MDDGGIRVALAGSGGVGRSLLELIIERGLPVRLVGVSDSKNRVVGELDVRDVLRGKAAGNLPGSSGDLLADGRPDVLIDAMSCEFDSGEPSLSLMLRALDAGISVVTANKVPLARAWTKLHDAALVSGASIGYSAAAGAALPAVAIARSLSRAEEVTGFRGVLTGTTTYVLHEMGEGASFADAVRSAQRLGIAEPDPTVDIGGWDTACKAVILANTVWGSKMELSDVAVQGIDASTDVSSGKVCVAARARREGASFVVEVGPQIVEPEDPLNALKGRDKGIVFDGPSIGSVFLAGGRSHPRGAAAALLGDLLEAGGR